jgi:hypothetical protein
MWRNRALLVALLSFACLSAGFAQPAATCASCHHSLTSSQKLTRMGRAAQWPGHNLALDRHPLLTFRRGPYQYTVKTHNGESKYIVSDGKHSISIPAVWSMGTPDQTWLLEYHGQWYSSMVSYYGKEKALDVTLGDENAHPTTLQQAIGRHLNTEGVVTCFGCHSTHTVVHHKLHLASFTPGVGCSHCHLRAHAHLIAMQKKGILGNVYPPDLTRMSTEDISNFCGRCHRSFATVVRLGWRGKFNVRFQPYRLALSKCFSGTDPRISCIACHDPHAEVVRNSAFYTKKCLACHSPANSKAPPYAKVCPISKTRCVSCHMPKVKYPGGHLIYTDHYIRIVKPNAPYPY